MLAIEPIQAFADNYIWLLRQPGNRRVAVVDPGDEEPVIERLQAEDLSLSAILITHLHGDHVGGIPGLLAAYPDIPVFGPARERISVNSARPMLSSSAFERSHGSAPIGIDSMKRSS